MAMNVVVAAAAAAAVMCLVNCGGGCQAKKRGRKRKGKKMLGFEPGPGRGRGQRMAGVGGAFASCFPLVRIVQFSIISCKFFACAAGGCSDRETASLGDRETLHNYKL